VFLEGEGLQGERQAFTVGVGGKRSQIFLNLNILYSAYHKPREESAIARAEKI
jgi:hypothetical protein